TPGDLTPNTKIHGRAPRSGDRPVESPVGRQPAPTSLANGRGLSFAFLLSTWRGSRGPILRAERSEANAQTKLRRVGICFRFCGSSRSDPLLFSSDAQH